MKRFEVKDIIVKIIFFFSPLIFCGALQAKIKPSINLCTWNIQWGVVADTGKNCWSARRPLVESVIREFDFDIIGTQEFHLNQMDSILSSFPYYSVYGVQGVKNDPLLDNNNRNLVMYRQNRFKLLDKGTFWLAPGAPSTPLKGWGASQFRNCNWVKLKERESGHIFYYFVCHFSHMSQHARTESARLMCEMVPKIAGKYPAFIMGDLNAVETTDAIRILSDTFKDSRELSVTSPQGPYGTGHGYRINVKVRRIDYIFCYQGNGKHPIVVDEYQVIDRVFEGKTKTGSDHWPVRLKVHFE